MYDHQANVHVPDKNVFVYEHYESKDNIKHISINKRSKIENTIPLLKRKCLDKKFGTTNLYLQSNKNTLTKNKENV